MNKYSYSRLSQGNMVDDRDPSLDKRGLFSHLMFSWLSRTMSLGYARPLEEDDVPLRAVGQEDTDALTWKLEEALKAQACSEDRRKKKNLWRCLLKVIGWGDFLAYVITMMGESIFRFTQPILLSLLFQELSGESKTKWAYAFAVGISLTLFLQPFFKSHCEYVANLIAAKIRSALRGSMYLKVLNTTHRSLNEIGSGKVVSLTSKDLKPIHTFVKRFPYVFLAPVEVIILTVLLWRLVDIEALVGVLYLILIALYLYLTYQPLKDMRKQTTKLTGKRITLIENIVNAMRLVKMSAWEAHLTGSVDKVRKEEIQVVRYRNAVLASIMAIVSSCPVLPSFLSLVTILAAGHSLSPQTVFTTIALMGTVEVSFADYCYRGVYYATQFNATMEKLENFLFKENHQENNTSNVPDTYVQQLKGENTKYPNAKKEVRVTLSGVTSSIRQRGIFLLKNVSTDFQGRGFVGITGQIGCGKSSLLKAIAGELEISEGTVFSSGKIAYVAQIPWLFSGTIRDNIVFGDTYNESKMSAVLSACALKDDLDRFPCGDLTLVGERGITLSGGQRDRVALARAVYYNADIYLLDDPLSSIDAKVGTYIVEKCLHGLLSEKLILLVTHRLQYLQTSERIVFMKSGSIIREGTYAELANSQDENFRGFIAAKTAPRDGGPHDEGIAEEATDVQKEPAEGETEEVTKEDRQYGSVSWKTYWRYLRAGNSLAFLVLITFIVILPEAFNASSNVWLSLWTELPQHEKKATKNVVIYSSIVGVSVILEFVRAFTVIHAALNSSEMLHKSMLRAILRAPLRFFDTNPTGRILNRFSSDVDCMDERLPRDLLDVLQRLIFTAVAVILVSMVNRWIFIPAVPMVGLIFFLSRYYLRTSRETKRLSLITASPVLSHYVETIQGIETIRTYKKEVDFFSLLCRHQDHNTREWLIFNTTQLWFGLRVDIIFAVFSTAVVFTSIVLNNEAGATGLSITYAIQLVAKSLLALIAVSRMENWMTSTERVLTFTDLKPEPGYDVNNQAPTNWSKTGELRLQNVALRHYPGGPKALDDVTCVIPPGEKVGIVGRTGAGKSSLVAALFRTPDHEGKIFLGDVCLSELNLLEARSALSAIPQDPIFLSGTLRDNLDPFEEFSDEHIWSTLEKVHIKALLQRTPDNLYSRVTERGGNFSVGERQLICLARAMLQQKKVIMFDEATANVDYATERLIHETIKKQLEDCTVLTIAHRMTNVMDYDRILVLDRGRLMEFNTPETLIGQKDSMFAQLVHLNKL